MEVTRLSKKQQWKVRWKEVKTNKLEFDPATPSFREVHQTLSKFIGQQDSASFLEVGAYPGKYLWYFSTYFGYKPWGVEYVDSCARDAQKMLDDASIPAQIITCDFFDLIAKDHIKGGGWDLVGSFGFVEHFDEPEIAVSKHLDVTLPGGLVVISIPNHAGWNGKIMNYVDRETWKQHNCMSLKDLVDAFEKAGENKILFSGYIGHIGFWNTCVYDKAKATLGSFYPFFRAPLWLIEKIGRWIVPNNKWSSPDIIIVAKKTTSRSSSPMSSIIDSQQTFKLANS